MFQICLEDLKERLMISLIIDDHCRDVCLVQIIKRKLHKIPNYCGLMESNEAFDERRDKGKSHIRDCEARKLHWKISSGCISDGLSVPKMIHNWLFPASMQKMTNMFVQFWHENTSYILYKSCDIKEWMKMDIYQVKPKVCRKKLVSFVLRSRVVTCIWAGLEVRNILNQLLNF